MSKTVSTLAAKKSWLRERGPYEVKNGAPGWWVDGCCGYQVCGYFGTESEAVEAAVNRVRMMLKEPSGEVPIWLYPWTEAEREVERG